MTCEKCGGLGRSRNHLPNLPCNKKPAAAETKPVPRETIRPAGETNGHAEEGSWADWKAGVLAQLEDAEAKLKQQLDAVQRAQGEIRGL